MNFKRGMSKNYLLNKRQNFDPKWTRATFSCVCYRCKKIIRKDEDIYYFPLYKQVYCASEGCGKDESRKVEEVLQDEKFYSEQSL